MNTQASGQIQPYRNQLLKINKTATPAVVPTPEIPIVGRILTQDPDQLHPLGLARLSHRLPTARPDT
ncbi:MAG: hypothetical protein WBP89_10765, partial [Sedimenticolaceae bacterium]